MYKNKIMIIVIALALLFASFGCGGNSPEPSTENNLFAIGGEENWPNNAEISADKEDSSVSSKLSPEDQSFIAENGYLSHHSMVTEDSLSWEFDEAAGILVISGSGAMRDYQNDSPEWEVYKEEIKKIVIENGITTVGDYAFYSYTQLISVQLPDTIEYIGIAAFANDYQLEEIPFPAALKEIACQAFAEVKVHKPLSIPNGVEIIASGAFHANDFWDSISIPASVYYIEEGAFSNSLHVHDFVVDPANEYYTAVDGVLYNKEVSLLLEYPILKETENFAIPDTVTRIADYAFDINFFMRTLYIPKSVKEVGTDQFGLLRQIEEYIVEEGSELFMTDNGALLSKDGKTFYAYPVLNKAEEYTIPNSVQNIEFRAFTEAWRLKKLYVPEGIQSIGMSAFENMNGTEIYLPEGFIDTAAELDSLFVYSDSEGWDLGGGFTYVPNTNNCILAEGKQKPSAMTLYYAGSQEEWDSFAAASQLWLGSTMVICGK